MKEHLPALLVFLPLAGAWVTLALGLFSYRLSRWGTYAFLLAALFFSIAAFPKVLAEGSWHYSLGGWAPPWGIELVLTPFSVFLACFLLVAALAAFQRLGSFALLAGIMKSRETLGGSLFLILVSGILALLWVRDGFTIYLFLQLSLVAAAGLMACFSRQGWLDGFYFLLGSSLGASLVLAGFLFLFSATGTLHLDDLLAQLFISRNFSMALAAGFFLTAGWGYLFCFPTPFFFTRFLTQTPHFLLGLFSSMIVRVGAYLLFLILFFVLDVPGMTIPPWLTVLEYLLVFFFLAHFIFAARQKDFLYTTAFLSVAQLAFPLIGFVEGNKSALTGSLVELLSQILVVLGLFMALETLSQKPAGNYPLSKLAGLGRRDFGMALALIVIVFSIVGVPPTGGCFGKYYLVQGLLEKRDWLMLALLGATLLFNLWTVGLFLGLLFKSRKAGHPEPIPLSAKAPLYLLALLVLLLGVFHQGAIRNFIEPSLPKAYQNIPLPNVPFLGHQVE